MSLNFEERDFYEDHLKWLRVEASAIEKVEAKGAERGREEGREEGVTQGANQKAVEIACRMIQENSHIGFIAAVTGLSQKEILEIKKKN